MPSINNGLFAGRAGIAAHGTAIAVLADNIANANTTAYKTSRAEFSDLLAGSSSGGGGGVSVGSGSSVNAVTQIFNQGTFEFTGRGLDLGIDGEGFFIVQDNGARFYSRAGNFKIDAAGNLLNQNGLNVMGFPENGAGSLEVLNVNAVTATSVATRNVTMSGNLDAGAADTVVPAPGSTWAQVGAAASFQQSVEIYDTLGGSHTMMVAFFKTAPGVWEVRGYVDSSELAVVAPGTQPNPSIPVNITNATRQMTFDASGQKLTPAAPPDFPGVVPTAGAIAPATAGWNGWANGASNAAAVDFTFNFTQFAGPSTPDSITQDGKGQGNIVSFNVEANGNLYALLDNGQTTSIGTIGLATFSNPEGLRRNGNGLYSKTTESGEAVVGTPNVGQFGGIQAGALELSTSDIASDFIKLISLQRGFQGSSRIITSIDDLLNEVINLAR